MEDPEAQHEAFMNQVALMPHPLDEELALLHERCRQFQEDVLYANVIKPSKLMKRLRRASYES